MHLFSVVPPKIIITLRKCFFFSTLHMLTGCPGAASSKQAVELSNPVACIYYINNVKLIRCQYSMVKY